MWQRNAILPQLPPSLMKNLLVMAVQTIISIPHARPATIFGFHYAPIAADDVGEFAGRDVIVRAAGLVCVDVEFVERVGFGVSGQL